MSNDKQPSVETTMDSELHAWLESATDEVCDVIVEAALPPRRINFQKRPGRKASPKSIESSKLSERKKLLDELANKLSTIVGIEKTHILQTAGAIVVRATADAIQAIAKEPKVKAIHINRRFK